MEGLLNIKIEKLQEGYYLATSDELKGLVAQGRTIAETLEIAQDVARKILEAKTEREKKVILGKPLKNKFEYSLIIGY
jgi:predicted RNase H-like HicB family nuclease